MNDTVISLKNVCKYYQMGASTIHALKSVNLEVPRGEFMAVMGPSGSGKSTLMNILGLLDHPDSGEYFIDGVEISSLSDNQRSDLRNETIGFIFQNFNLLPRASALRNVVLPLTYRTLPNQERVDNATIALGKVGLKDRMEHRPTEMSGGERQRVAIARALVGNPAVILADEPTGNLDSKTGDEIMAILEKLSQEGQTVIMVTHDPNLAERADRIVYMKDGELSVRVIDHKRV